jgi:predicted nucleotidyltransferase component of viral defense system
MSSAPDSSRDHPRADHWRAAEDGVPARTVERDYVLAHVLTGVARLDDARLVFKGGTALRFCYLDDFRYSADLDFSIIGTDTDQARMLIAEALRMVRDESGFDLLELDDRLPPRIRFVGPLGRERFLKLDLADDELVVDSHQLQMRSQWDDVPDDASLRVYTVTEIGGEKLRCVLQRLQCRDLHDLDALFETLALDPGEAAVRFRRKAEHRGLDPDLFAERYELRLPEYERRWSSELQEHLADVPHFDAVRRRVTRRLRAADLL